MYRLIFHSLAILLSLVVTSVEPINTSASVHKFLFTSEERMAFGADIHADFRYSGLSLIGSAACASYGSRTVLRMNSFLHSFHLFQLFRG